SPCASRRPNSRIAARGSILEALPSIPSKSPMRLPPVEDHRCALTIAESATSDRWFRMERSEQAAGSSPLRLAGCLQSPYGPALSGRRSLIVLSEELDGSHRPKPRRFGKGRVTAGTRLHAHGASRDLDTCTAWWEVANAIHLGALFTGMVGLVLQSYRFR